MTDIILKNIEKLGAVTIDAVNRLGRIVIFFVQGVLQVFVFPFQFYKIIEHTWFIGMKSLLVIMLTGIFTGMVLGLQGYYTLVKFGAEGALGAAVALSLIRELGPVLTAIMITARAGSAMAAEIGVMRISEQIDALETMDINPIRFIFSPRIIASIISFPLLTSVFDLIGIFGGFLTGPCLMGTNPGMYFYKVRDSVIMGDIKGGFIKSVVFAVVVTTICCSKGFFTHLQSGGGFGAKGVSSATTTAVVDSCVLIFICDYIITYLLI